ncbi:hypothetical protein [Sinomonas sp. B1-1]|uniref:hypothetical protein n=1 Tax=Sinomonas sp. B1-1 TaxID=3141454 RepID=UPI003D2A0852
MRSDVPADSPTAGEGQPGASPNLAAVPWEGAVAGVAAGLVFLALCLASVLLAAAGGAVQSVGNSLPGVGDAVPEGAVGAVVGVAAQVGAMALLGTSEGRASAGLGMQGSVSAFVVPFGLTVVAAVLALWAGAVQARLAPAPSVAVRAAQSGALGVGFAATTTAIAASARVHSVEPGTTLDLSAAGVVPFLVALVLGAATGWIGSGIGRPSTPRPLTGSQTSSVAALLLPPVKACAAHLLVFSLIAAPVAWIVGGVQGGWGATLSGPLWLGHAVAGAFTIGHVGGISAGSSATMRGDGLYYFLAGDGGPVPVWAAWLLVVLALVATAVAGAVLSVARGAAAGDRRSAWTGPVAYAFAGLVILGVFHVSVDVTFSAFLGTGSARVSAGPSAWSPLVLAGWGLLAEVASRTLAPYALGALPAPVLAGLGRRLGPQAPPAGTPAPDGHGAVLSAAASGEAPTHDAGAAAAAGTAPAASPALRTLSPRARKRALVVAVAVVGVGLLVGAGAIAVAVVKVGKGPDAVVRAYLDDVVAGRAEAAMEKVSPNVPNESRALLSDDVYGKAGGRIDRYSVVSTESAGNASTVVVELSQGGRTERQTFTVSKRDPSLLDDHWTVDSGSLVRPLTVAVNTKNPKVLANGTAVSTGASDVKVGNSYAFGAADAPTGPDGWLSDRTTAMTFYALPGEYTFGIDTGSPLLEVPEQRLRVAIGAQAPATAGLRAAPSRAFQDQLDASVKAFLDRCAARTELSKSSSSSDSACPFDRSAWSGYDYRNVHWSITKAPAYTVGDRVYSDGAVAVQPKAPGAAELTYQSKSTSSYAKDSPYTDTKDSTSIYLYGVAKVRDGKVEFQYAPYGSYTPGS